MGRLAAAGGGAFDPMVATDGGTFERLMRQIQSIAGTGMLDADALRAILGTEL
jgi:hypothetical protein